MKENTGEINIVQTTLLCPCGATAKDTSKERGRFLTRHPLAGFPSMATDSLHALDVQAGKSRHAVRVEQQKQPEAKRKATDAVALAIVSNSIRSARNA